MPELTTRDSATERTPIQASTLRFNRRVFLSRATGVLAVGWLMIAAAAAEPKFPSLDQVQAAVEKQFTTLTDFLPNDLISRKQVAPVFDALKMLGWNVADRPEILQAVPAEDEFFVRRLRSADGKKFMRQISKYQVSYDRIDRLSGMIMGEQNLNALIRGPDGYKMIQYMTGSPYGRNLGIMLSKDPRGGDFNSPTGRIYTVDALLARLTQSYVAEQKARQQAGIAQ